jgi:hypothetical protein
MPFTNLTSAKGHIAPPASVGLEVATFIDVVPLGRAKTASGMACHLIPGGVCFLNSRNNTDIMNIKMGQFSTGIRDKHVDRHETRQIQQLGLHQCTKTIAHCLLIPCRTDVSGKPCLNRREEKKAALHTS